MSDESMPTYAPLPELDDPTVARGIDPNELDPELLDEVTE